MRGPSRHALRRRTRLAAAWLGLFAIVAQAFLPILHPLAAPHGLVQVLASAPSGGATAVICTPYGFKVVTLDELPPADDGSTKKENGKSRFCPLCQAANAVANAVPPTAPMLDVPVVEVRVAFIAAAEALAHRPATANLQARAPPPIV